MTAKIIGFPSARGTKAEPLDRHQADLMRKIVYSVADLDIELAEECTRIPQGSKRHESLVAIAIAMRAAKDLALRELNNAEGTPF